MDFYFYKRKVRDYGLSCQEKPGAKTSSGGNNNQAVKAVPNRFVT
jgi:hypothetical protein